MSADAMPKKPWPKGHEHGIFITTYGKIVFNQLFPDDYFYINEPTEENLNNPLDAKYFLGEGEEIDKKIDEVGDDLIASPFKGSFLSDSIATIYKYYKAQRTSE